MVRLLSRDDFIAIEMQIFESVSKWLQNHEDNNNLVADCIKLERFSKKELLSLGQSNRVNATKVLKVLLEIENGSLVYPAREIRDKNLATIKFGPKVISEVSTDNKSWLTVIDYKDFACRSYQNLYFKKTSGKFVKFIGNFTQGGSGEFHMSSVEIYLRDETPQVVNGVIRPTENVATPPQAIVFGVAHSEALINGDKRLISSNVIGSFREMDCITIQLAQPFLISSARLLLDKDKKYKYLIETSVNREDWQVAVDKRNEECTGWQNFEFEERPVVFIRITGTKNLVMKTLKK